MATADELRKQIEQNRQALREALQGVKSWEDGTDENWGAKRIAKHTVRGGLRQPRLEGDGRQAAGLGRR